MFSTTHNRNRAGRFSHKDDSHRTAQERKAFRAAEAELMANQIVPVVNLYTEIDRRATEIETLKAKAAATKNPVNRGIYEAEIARLSR
jgi:hypothetical protein